MIASLKSFIHWTNYSIWNNIRSHLFIKKQINNIYENNIHAIIWFKNLIINWELKDLGDRKISDITITWFL